MFSGKYRWRVSSALFLSLAMLLAACGDDEGPGKKEPPRSEKEAKILFFEINDEEVQAGAKVHLSWATQDAQTLLLLANGTPLVIPAESKDEGSREFEIWADTRFELVATGGDGVEVSAEREVKVVTAAVQIVSFTAKQEKIEAGQRTSLRWETAGAVSVSIQDEKGGSVLSNSPLRSGEIGVQPSLSTTYQLQAVGADDQVAKAQVSVEVEPVILLFAAEDEGPKAPGEGLRLRWKARGASTLHISNGEGFEDQRSISADAEGLLSAQMGSQGRFLLTVSHGSLAKQAEIQVPVLSAPQILAFEADRPYWSLGQEAEPRVTLSWQIERASQIEVWSDTLGSIAVDDKDPAGDSVIVLPSEDSKFTLTAKNAAGQVSAEVDVLFVPMPRIESFAAIPGRVGVGERFLLTWASADSEGVTIEDNLGAVLVSDGAPQGSLESSIAADTSFTLRAWNKAGDSVEETLQVGVGAPIVETFVSSRDHVAVGESFELSWKNLGGDRLEVRDSQDQVICSAQSQAEVFAGSCVHSEAQVGEHRYTLQVWNGIQESDSATLEVLVTDGPLVLAFEVSPQTLSEGEAIQLSWEVTKDATGAIPTLELYANGVSLPLGEHEPEQDSKSFTLEQTGSVTLRLVASSPEGSNDAERTIFIHALPDLQLSASPPIYDGLQPVELSWTTRGTEGSLKLYAFDRLGQRLEPPLYVVPEAERTSGSFSVSPSIWDAEAEYLLVGENIPGKKAEESILVTVGEPVAVRFEAVPAEVVDGDPVELVWEIQNADHVRLDLHGLEISEITAAFHDIRASGNELGLGTAGKLWERVDLAAHGLSIPWGDKDFDYFRVTERGFLTFGESLRDDRRGNLDYPSLHHLASSASSMNYFQLSIAPYWGGIETRKAGSGVAAQFLPSPTGKHQYIVQWTGANRDSEMSNREDVDLTFQIALYEDGDFDIRYADMLPVDEPQANGGRVTIGYMFEGDWEPNAAVYSHYEQFHFGGNTLGSGNTPYPGGLSQRSFAYRHRQLPLSGRESYIPEKSETRELIAMSGARKRFHTDVIVHPRAAVSASAPTGESQEGAPFSLGWTSSDAEKIEVLDAQMTVRCTITEASQVASGSCELSEETAGFYTYTVRATGALGHQVEDQATVQVLADLQLYSFEASAEEVNWNQPLVLSWQTKGAAIFTLTANGVAVPVAAEEWAQGQLTFHPKEETLYHLELRSSDGRTREAQQVVTVRTMSFDSATIDRSSVLPGEQVQFDWQVTSYTGVQPSIFINAPLREVDASPGSPHAFADIRDTGTHLPMQSCPGGPTSVNSEGCENLLFPNGFTFPFGGDRHSSMWVFVKGVASFEGPPGRNTLNNLNLPIETGEEGAFVNLAPFWDNLFYPSNTTGDIYYQLDESDPAKRSLTVQWTQARFALAVTDTDLTFQVVLFEDGSFEFRYLIMQGHTEAFEIRAAGSSATIGYQFPGGFGSHVIYQGGERSTQIDPFPGGFTGRSWRAEGFDPSSGKVQVLESHDYLLCAKLGTFVECKEFPVEADWGIRSFSADKERVRAHDPVRLSWETFQGEHISLLGNGQEIDVSHLNRDQDSIQLYPLEKTDYVLRLHSLWRTHEEELTVEVETFEKLAISTNKTFVAAGDALSVSWSADALVPGEIDFDLNLPYMVEVEGAPYNSIESTGTLVPGLTTRNRLSTVEFPPGFTFPYYGSRYSQVHISNMGYLSFDVDEASSTATGNANPVKIPGSPAMAAKHLSVFWEGIYRNTGQNSEVYVQHVEEDLELGEHFIIEWYNFSFTSSTTAANVNRDNMSFQALLFPDGRFEYRFGEMVTTNTASFLDRVQGSQAMIGYQDPSGELGQAVSWAILHEQGLSHRSWRYAPPSRVGNSLTFFPEQSFTPQVCAELGGDRLCVDGAPVHVLQPGDLLITELQLDPVSGSQWFELRNMSQSAIDLEGFVIRTNVGSHTIQGSLPLGKGEYLVLAAAADPELAPDYVHGLELYTTVGEISLEVGGRSFAHLEWNPAWPRQQGRSLQLDPMRQFDPGVAFASKSSDFCFATEIYGSAGNQGSPGSSGPPCNPLVPFLIDYNAAVEGLDISGIATAIFPGEENYNKFDNSEEGLALPFAFPFYGDSFSKVWANSNGFVSFGPFTSNFSTNYTIPGTQVALVNGAIAPFWDALRPSEALGDGATEWASLQVDGQKVVVIRWRNTISTARSREASSDLDFQLQLWEDGTFDFVYTDIQDGHWDTQGNSATIGFQKQAPSANREGHLFSYNSRTPIPKSGRVIRITPRP